MEFDNKYLTYEEYVELSGKLQEMPFNLLELEARTNIKRETFDRIEEEIPDEVKLCMFRLIEVMAYDGAYKDADSKEKRLYINRIIHNLLDGIIYNDVPLTYRGV